MQSPLQPALRRALPGLLPRRAVSWGQRLLLVGGIVLMTSVVYAIAARLMGQGFERIERTETLLNVERTRHALDARLEQLDALAVSWTQWDEALAFVRAPRSAAGRAFVESNLSDAAAAQLQCNVVVYADRQGRMVYATGYDLPRKRNVPLAPALRRALSKPSLLRHRTAQSRVLGLLPGPGGPLLVVSRPVLRADGKGPIGGTLLLGINLDGPVQNELGRAVGLPVATQGFMATQPPDFAIARTELLAPADLANKDDIPLFPSGAGDSTLPTGRPETLEAAEQRALKREGLERGALEQEALERETLERTSFVRPLNEKSVAGYTLVRAVNEQPAALLRVVAPRVAYAQQQASVRNMLWALVGIGTLAALGLLFMQERLSASTALHREDEARMRSFFQGMGEGLLITDLHDRVQDANGRMEEMCGFTLDEMRGKPAYEFLLEPARWPSINTFNERRAQGHADVYEVELLRKDGSKFWSLIHATPLRDAGGRVVGTIGAQIDISERKKIEDDLGHSVVALQESENRFRSLIEQAVDAVIVHDAQGRIVDGNERLCQTLGYTREEMLQLHVADFETQFESEKVAERWTSMVPGRPIFVNGVQRRKDGSTFPVEVHVGLVQLDGRQVYLAIARDITERQRIEARLAQSLLERERIMETVPDVIFQLDLEGRLIAWNRRLETMTGFDSGELQDKNALWFFPPEEQDKITQAIATAHREGSVEVESRLRLKNGTLLPTSWNAVPLRDEAGQVIGLTGTGRDLSERLRNEREREEAQARLLAAEARFWSVVQTATDAIIIADSTGHIVSWNDGAQKMFGYTESEAVGQSLTLLMPERFAHAHHSALTKVSAGAEARLMGTPLELTGCRRDGAEFPLELTLNMWHDGEQVFYASIIRDITRRKASQAQIQASLHEKEVLLKEIHHRVKNNMQVISSLLNRQVRNVADPQTRELFKDAQNRIKSMALIHERLYQQDTLASVDFAGYLRQLTGQLLRSHHTGQVELLLQLDPLELGIDAAVAGGLIVNELISNAFKHGFADRQSFADKHSSADKHGPTEGKVLPARRGQLSVTLHCEGTQAVLSVADNGAGMAPGLDPFATRSLGMRLVADLTDQIKGTLDLASSPEGTRWTLSIPLPPTGASSNDEAEDGNAHGEPTGSKTAQGETAGNSSAAEPAVADADGPASAKLDGNKRAADIPTSNGQNGAVSESHTHRRSEVAAVT